jgi:hypothetical protein
VKVHDVLVATYPPWLDRRRLEQEATSMLLSCLALMTIFGHLAVVVRVLQISTFVRAADKQKAASFFDRLSLKLDL